MADRPLTRPHDLTDPAKQGAVISDPSNSSNARYRRSRSDGRVDHMLRRDKRRVRRFVHWAGHVRPILIAAIMVLRAHDAPFPATRQHAGHPQAIVGVA